MVRLRTAGRTPAGQKPSNPLSVEVVVSRPDRDEPQQGRDQDHQQTALRAARGFLQGASDTSGVPSSHFRLPQPWLTPCSGDAPPRSGKVVSIIRANSGRFENLGKFRGM